MFTRRVKTMAKSPISSPFARTRKLNGELLSVEPEVCIERARLVTASYQETEGEPMIIRRAKALAKVLREMTIFIQKDQLIVGNQASKLRASPLFPETEAGYLERELDIFPKRGQDRLIIPDEVKQELQKEVFPYWMGKTTEDIALKAIPPESKEIFEHEHPVFCPDIHLKGSIGHVIVDYDRVLSLGISGIKKQVEEKLQKLDLPDPEELDKYHFYKAELIVCEAIVEWAERFAREARKLATGEKDEEWKAELEQIAKICEWVPENPARTFRQAVQSFWFTHLPLYIEQNGLAVSPGRLDQYLYPYYKKDKEEGRITKEEAQELLECLWIKFTEVMRAYDYNDAKYFAGFSISENVVLGGQTRSGEDATNELSFLCLEVEKNTKLSQPNLGVRIHAKTPDEFLMKAVEVISTGRTKPEIFNDDVGILSLTSLGVPLEDARNYSISGCVEAVPPHTNGMTNAAMSNLAKALELALNDGKCRLCGKKLGLKTGDPRNFTSFDQVIDAYRKQVAYYVKHMVTTVNTIEKVHAQIMPLPYFSLVIDDCREEGKDVTWGGARYDYTGPQGVGLASVADSLAAIKKLVFDEKKVTMDELIEAMDTNFEGKETLRQILINEPPKYSNDNDYADNIAREVGVIYCQEVSKYHNTRGGKYRPGLYSVSANVPLGIHVGALPDGRKAKSPLSDGVSPAHGTERSGPTAIVKSVAKLDHTLVTNGTQLNMKFSPRVLSDLKGKRNLANLIRTFFDLGGWHIQFNVVSADTLREAQRKPDDYRWLIIRVAGYSAFFLELDKAVQDDIIDRTEYQSV
ncbi:glycyl radical protein [Candidatus Aerophobetes bacterium]|uniref:Glycyl radical protein n=1 Tax=Aerophobetes bacterium TaxID=2030807 RepID=A0A523QKQ3_UNCAE|nr:MAG: glycyl radical protein [Candidatus Aerophobetes bacterium]